MIEICDVKRDNKLFLGGAGMYPGYILGKISEEKDIFCVNEYLLGLIQLYFDGMIEKKEEPVAIESLYRAAKETVSSLYLGKDIDLEKVIGEVKSYSGHIRKSCNDAFAITGRVDRDYENIAIYGRAIQDIMDIDYCVSVAHGAWQPAILASVIFDADILGARYSRFRRNDSCVKVIEDFRVIEGKNLLLVEDEVVTGRSIREVGKYCEQFKPSKLYASVVRPFNMDEDTVSRDIAGTVLF